MLVSLHGSCFLANHKKLGRYAMGGGKILADKFFVLPSRLEMKRPLHRLTLIYEEHSQLNLQFLYFLNGKETFIWHSLASLVFLFGRSGKWEHREFGNSFSLKTYYLFTSKYKTLHYQQTYFTYISHTGSTKYKRKTHLKHLHNTKILYIHVISKIWR